MLEWKYPEPNPPLPEAKIRFGDVHLTVKPSDNATQWLGMSLCCGRFSDSSHEECLESWPREVLKLARKALDDFEAKL